MINVPLQFCGEKNGLKIVVSQTGIHMEKIRLEFYFTTDTKINVKTKVSNF